jgi:hypothetical protein
LRVMTQQTLFDFNIANNFWREVRHEN